MNNGKRIAAAVLAALCLLPAAAVRALAGGAYYSSGENGADAPPDAIEEITISMETVLSPSASEGGSAVRWDVNAVPVTDDSGYAVGNEKRALTPAANMTLVDDILQDESTVVKEKTVVRDKQFLTVTTRNGNVFYLIVDRSGETENVYFLNMVDETDLFALLDDGEAAPVCSCVGRCEAGEVDTSCPVCKNDLSRCKGKAQDRTDTDSGQSASVSDTEKETVEESRPTGGVLAVVAVALLGGGFALYWFRFRKKQPGHSGIPFGRREDGEDMEANDREE